MAGQSSYSCVRQRLLGALSGHISCLRSERATRRWHLPEHGSSSFGLFAGRQQPVKNTVTASITALSDRVDLAVVVATPFPVGAPTWCGLFVVRRSAGRAAHEGRAGRHGTTWYVSFDVVGFVGRTCIPSVHLSTRGWRAEIADDVCSRFAHVVRFWSFRLARPTLYVQEDAF